MIDLLRNNFEQLNSHYVSLNEMHLRVEDGAFIQSEQAKVADGRRIIKSHATPRVREFFFDAECVAKCAEQAIESGKVIYMVRDVRDVMVSLFHYIRNNDSLDSRKLNEFIRQPNDYYPHEPEYRLSRAEYWAYHVSSWRSAQARNSANVLFVPFEAIIADPESVCRNVSVFLGVTRNRQFLDVRRTEIGQHSKAMLSSQSFRRGRTGDWKDYFDSSSQAYVDLICGTYKITLP